MVHEAKSAAPARNTCQYPRCVALAIERGAYCAVHEKAPGGRGPRRPRSPRRPAAPRASSAGRPARHAVVTARLKATERGPDHDSTRR